jgi:hypothetical protein
MRFKQHHLLLSIFLREPGDAYSSRRRAVAYFTSVLVALALSLSLGEMCGAAVSPACLLPTPNHSPIPTDPDVPPGPRPGAAPPAAVNTAARVSLQFRRQCGRDLYGPDSAKKARW